MIVVVKKNTPKEQMENLTAWLKSLGIETHPTIGKMQTIIGLVGDTSKIDIDLIKAWISWRT